METVDQFFNEGEYSSSIYTAKNTEQLKSGDNFSIDDLLDFSNEDTTILDASGEGLIDKFTGNSTDSSTITVVDSCNSSNSANDPNLSGDFPDFPDVHFSNDLCVPYDDLAELEWISNIAEESFSSEDLQKIQLLSGIKTRPEEVSETREITLDINPNFNPEISVPARARSKRSRSAPCDWSSRLLHLSPSTTSSSDSDITSNSGKKSSKAISRKREASENSSTGGEGRRCLHCATDKTPQWRTGPMGPKTLCNACGVRYKSGRLVPEYRPAASPTFVLAKHSNSHRKVMELRRQKDMQRPQHQQFFNPNLGFDVSSSNGEDYLIHHHRGPDYTGLL